jgi:eukaryotic-like serine/threonine-protein kinase
VEPSDDSAGHIERRGAVSVDAPSPHGSAGSVGDRYRLVECVAGDPDGPAVAWRAWDTLLARAVTLTVVRPGGSAAHGFLSHAHAVSSILHPGLARVYDAVDDGNRAYVVSEWVSGTPLTALLREGALDPEAAAGTVARVAEGVAAAHAAGVAFGGVHPDHVIVTPGGTVTLAQVVGDGRAAPADDIRGLGALLYAALTAHWPLAPTGGAAALRSASANGGHLLTPRQVRAGVPEDLSTLAMRALDPAAPHGVRSAAALATVLGERTQHEEIFPFGHEDARGRGRRHPRWLALVLPVVAAFAVLALVGWLVGSALGRVPGANRTPSTVATDPATSAGPTSGTSAQTQAALQAVAIAGATLYDPSPSSDGAESKKIADSYDGDLATSWPTDRYKRNATFGNLKKGLGIAYDMGEPTVLRRVQIVTDKPGIDLQILAGDSPNAADPSAYRVVGEATGLSSTQTIQLGGGQPARYYIVWITKLVPAENGDYDASLAEVKFFR